MVNLGKYFLSLFPVKWVYRYGHSQSYHAEKPGHTSATLAISTRLSTRMIEAIHDWLVFLSFFLTFYPQKIHESYRSSRQAIDSQAVF